MKKLVALLLPELQFAHIGSRNALNNQGRDRMHYLISILLYFLHHPQLGDIGRLPGLDLWLIFGEFVGFGHGEGQPSSHIDNIVVGSLPQMPQTHQDNIFNY